MKVTRLMSVFTLAALLAASVSFAANNPGPNITNKFEGPKANTGMAVFSKVNGKTTLRVTDDFKVPDTPAPTWRVVDSKGNIYTLDAFKIKEGRGEKREITVPAYIPNIVKVQVYCAWAQVLLGEASFPAPVK